MNVKDKIIEMLKRSFGIKALTSIDEIENVDTYGTSFIDTSINSTIGELEHSENQFDQSLKVDSNSILAVPNFQKLSSEIRTELINSFNEFKQTVLENEEMKIVKQSQQEGKMGETPFMCFAEVDSNGKLRSNIIVTKNSCIKTSEDDEENIVYQETRQGKNGMQTVINDKLGSIYINGNMSQKDIDNIKNFSDKNYNNITKLPKRFDDQTRKEYKEVLKELGVKTDIDINDKNKFMYIASGKPKRDNGIISELNEISCVFDKENSQKNPIIIAINSQKDNKIASKKFRLTESGKYIDESSFKIIDGEPQYALLDYEQVMTYGKEKGLDTNYFERTRMFLKENKPLIPNAAVSIHKSMERKQEREQRTQNNQIEEEDKTL